MIELRWTKAELAAEIARRADAPDHQLLAIFDVVAEAADEGAIAAAPLAASTWTAGIRDLLHSLAHRVGLAEPESFAAAWRALMDGSLVAAIGGDVAAIAAARAAGALALDHWPRAE